MADPQIQYCTTSDGLSIAYTTLGEGEPLVILAPLGYSHIQIELGYPPLRQWYDRLAQRRMVVRFDWRAQGLSQRNVPSPPASWALLDLDAVFLALGVERVDLFGCVWTVAAAYAGTHREHVRNLILWTTGTVPAHGGAWGSREVEAALSLLDKDFATFTETMAGSILGWSEPATAHTFAQFIRAAMNEADHHTFETPGPPLPREILLAIEARTLVIHPSGFRNMPVQNAQKAASAIRGARLVICTDGGWMPTGEQATVAVESFLGDSPAGAESRPERPSGMAVVLFMDIVDSTALTERMGDAAFRASARALDEGMRAAIREAGGTPVEGKVLGDGVMAVFTSASQAIDAARRCLGEAEAAQLQLHVGLHAGDVIQEGGNVYGGAVNIASRICGLSAPGEVLVSATVRELARTSAGVTFEDRGEHALKGVDDAVRLYEVRWRD